MRLRDAPRRFAKSVDGNPKSVDELGSLQNKVNSQNCRVDVSSGPRWNGIGERLRINCAPSIGLVGVSGAGSEHRQKETKSRSVRLGTRRCEPSGRLTFTHEIAHARCLATVAGPSGVTPRSSSTKSAHASDNTAARESPRIRTADISSPKVMGPFSLSVCGI